MTNLKFEYQPEKALEAILYIAKRTQEPPTFMRVVKLLYLADKTSLEKYGRFITGDTYYAMKDGPVPTNAYHLLKHENENDIGFEIEYKKYPIIQPYRDANIDHLSESDTTCIDKVLVAFDRLPTWALREMSHDEAWQETWNEAGEQGSSEIPLQRIVKLLENGDELLDYLENQNNS